MSSNSRIIPTALILPRVTARISLPLAAVLLSSLHLRPPLLPLSASSPLSAVHCALHLTLPFCFLRLNFASPIPPSSQPPPKSGAQAAAGSPSLFPELPHHRPSLLPALSRLPHIGVGPALAPPPRSSRRHLLLPPPLHRRNSLLPCAPRCHPGLFLHCTLLLPTIAATTWSASPAPPWLPLRMRSLAAPRWLGPPPLGNLSPALFSFLAHSSLRRLPPLASLSAGTAALGFPSRSAIAPELISIDAAFSRSGALAFSPPLLSSSPTRIRCSYPLSCAGLFWCVHRTTPPRASRPPVPRRRRLGRCACASTLRLVQCPRSSPWSSSSQCTTPPSLSSSPT